MLQNNKTGDEKNKSYDFYRLDLGDIILISIWIGGSALAIFGTRTDDPTKTSGFERLVYGKPYYARGAADSRELEVITRERSNNDSLETILRYKGKQYILADSSSVLKFMKY